MENIAVIILASAAVVCTYKVTKLSFEIDRLCQTLSKPVFRGLLDKKYIDGYME